LLVFSVAGAAAEELLEGGGATPLSAAAAAATEGVVRVSRFRWPPSDAGKFEFFEWEKRCERFSVLVELVLSL